MIRSFIIALAIAFVSVVVTWFLIPAATYIENALGIILLVFFVSFVFSIFPQRILLSKKINKSCQVRPLHGPDGL